MPRGRPKGSKNINVNVCSDIEETMQNAIVKIQEKTTASSSNSEGPQKYKRDENGLLQNVNYSFNEDGSINWRAMVKDEYLFPNKSWFEARKKETPRTIEGLKDHQLLIKLAGIKELAKLRGFNSCSYQMHKCEQDHVAVSCSILFIGNYETEGKEVVFNDMANATLNNTSSFATKFLETIACNRAFVRCVRNFLNIHIVGDDEIDKSNGLNPARQQSNSSILSPQGALKSEAGGIPFEDFKNLLRRWHKENVYVIDSSLDPSDWNCYEDIPPKQAREFLRILKSTSSEIHQ